MPDGRTQTGTVSSEDCNVADNGNAGCGVKAPIANSYGPPFSNNGGGWYAMERTASFIKAMWFWARDDTSVPSDVSTGTGTMTQTTGYDSPFTLSTCSRLTRAASPKGGSPAYFPSGTDCGLASHFGANNIIVDLTLCGDWAGAVFNADGCPGDCPSYVNANPSAFSEAYRDIAAARVYE